MSLKNSLVPVESKIAVMEHVKSIFRETARSGSQFEMNCYETVKSILGDLEARRDLPRSLPLGRIQRQLEAVLQSKTAIGYDAGRLQELGNLVIGHWPTIRQALEQFGEESAE